MPRYVFFLNGDDIRVAISESVYAEQLTSTPGVKKIAFETEASDQKDAQLKLKNHLEENTDALKEFTGSTGFSAVIESLLR